MLNEQEHLLVCIGEEGVEIAQAADKALRFGLADRNPHEVDALTNREKLARELNDILGVARMLVDFGVLPANWENLDQQNAKVGRVLRYMLYAQEQGTLSIGAAVIFES